MSSILSNLTNLEKAPIMLNRSETHNLSGNFSIMISVLVNQYKSATLIKIIKIFGWIDVLGNLVYLFKNIGSVVKDFFQKPIQGIVQGPLEGLRGLL